MASDPARGVTIRIFLVDGTAQGLRLVERMGWTGSFLAFARADFTSARGRDEVSRTGVYVLIGPDDEGRRTQRAYIGEADDIRGSAGRASEGEGLLDARLRHDHKGRLAQ